MMIRSLLVLLLAGVSLLARADSTNLLVKIGAEDAGRHYNESLTVTGMVAQVTLRPTIVFINLDRPYPDSPFAAIIHSSATNQFGNLKRLKGRSIEITGKIVNYHDRPEMVLDEAGQLLVLTNLTSLPATSSAPAAAPAAKGTNDLTNGVM